MVNHFVVRCIHCILPFATVKAGSMELKPVMQFYLVRIKPNGKHKRSLRSRKFLILKNLRFDTEKFNSPELYIHFINVKSQF